MSGNPRLEKCGPEFGHHAFQARFVAGVVQRPTEFIDLRSLESSY